MKKEDLINKYKHLRTYKAIALEGYGVGLKEGREENKDAKFRSMEKELKKLKLIVKEQEEILNNGEALADYIAGI